eukprot:TRINITY_DN4319_c0_g1_i1.p1 TRINITY_DN4319_c0_g1~~TRINITY_DN4319_c0_g1_i1.p1  ORF type:complete len:403 (-),score=89.00 TRINITY_DN4319_c0_g1_i1:121-1329(-)
MANHSKKCLHVVHPDWILDSCKKFKLQDEHAYSILKGIGYSDISLFLGSKPPSSPRSNYGSFTVEVTPYLDPKEQHGGSLGSIGCSGDNESSVGDGTLEQSPVQDSASRDGATKNSIGSDGDLLNLEFTSSPAHNSKPCKMNDRSVEDQDSVSLKEYSTLNSLQNVVHHLTPCSVVQLELQSSLDPITETCTTELQKKSQVKKEKKCVQMDTPPLKPPKCTLKKPSVGLQAMYGMNRCEELRGRDGQHPDLLQLPFNSRSPLSYNYKTTQLPIISLSNHNQQVGTVVGEKRDCENLPISETNVGNSNSSNNNITSNNNSNNIRNNITNHNNISNSNSINSNNNINNNYNHHHHENNCNHNNSINNSNRYNNNKRNCIDKLSTFSQLDLMDFPPAQKVHQLKK